MIDWKFNKMLSIVIVFLRYLPVFNILWSVRRWQRFWHSIAMQQVNGQVLKLVDHWPIWMTKQFNKFTLIFSSFQHSSDISHWSIWSKFAHTVQYSCRAIDHREPRVSKQGRIQNFHLACLGGGAKDYIVWLSLIWDTDWLNTVTWLTNISVCCPPQSCGGGTLIDTTKCFHSGKIFHANKWQNGLAILSLQTCMLTALTAHWLFIARTVQWMRVALRRTVQWIRIVLRAT